MENRTRTGCACNRYVMAIGNARLICHCYQILRKKWNRRPFDTTSYKLHLYFFMKIKHTHSLFLAEKCPHVNQIYLFIFKMTADNYSVMAKLQNHAFSFKCILNATLYFPCFSTSRKYHRKPANAFTELMYLCRTLSYFRFRDKTSRTQDKNTA